MQMGCTLRVPRVDEMVVETHLSSKSRVPRADERMQTLKSDPIQMAGLLHDPQADQRWHLEALQPLGQ